MVVGWSDFAMDSHMHTEDKEPDGTAAGLTSNATQQSKHFQCGSATVLCGTVNSKAWRLLPKPARGRFCVRRGEICALGQLTCLNDVNRMRQETGLPIRRMPANVLTPPSST